MEILEPKKKRSPIESLKFQRKSDYKKFRNFIKKETKELKGIVEPKQDKLKNILNVGAVGLGFLTIRGILGAIKGKDGDDTSGKFQTPFIVGKRNPNDSPDFPEIPDLPDKLPVSIANRSRIPKPVKKKIKVSKLVKTKVKNPVTKKSTIRSRAKVTPSGSPINIEQGQFSNRKRMGDPPDNVSSNPKKRAFDYFEKTKKIEVLKKDVEFVGDDVFLNRKYTNTPEPVLKLEVETFSGEDFYSFNEADSKRLTDQRKSLKLKRDMLERTFQAIDQVPEGEVEATKKLIESQKSQGAFTKLKSRGSKIFDTLSKTTQNLTPQFLKSDLVKPLFKSKTKTGFFVIDLLFAGQAFADLFKPKDNIRTSVVDLYNAINNQIYKDDPSKLKYYITESSDERIRAYHMQKNKEIRLLKEKAGVNLGGPQNILIVPENKQENQVNSTIPIKKGETEVSFVPFEPLNSVGTDILLHKLNQ
jgi:hypothetical protein